MVLISPSQIIDEVHLFPEYDAAETNRAACEDSGHAPRKRANDLDGKTWTRYSISIWSDITKTAEEAALNHPAMFPLALVTRLIDIFTSVRDRVILDPFAGITFAARRRRCLYQNKLVCSGVAPLVARFHRSRKNVMTSS